TPLSGPAPLECAAEGLSSTPGAGAASTGYTFDFGEPGGSTSGPAPYSKHIYRSPGTYTVTLTITDSTGATSQDRKTITVTQPSGGPVARLSVSPAGGLEVSADGSASTPSSDAAILDYTFDFGEPGGSPSGPAPNSKHIYRSPGTYTVTLTITDSTGATSQDRKTITLTLPTPPRPAGIRPDSLMQAST